MLRKKFYVCVLCFFIYVTAFSDQVQSIRDNTGKNFLVMFLKNMDRPSYMPMQLSMTTLGLTSVEARIQTPKWSSIYSVNTTVIVYPDQLTVFNISADIRMTDSFKDNKSVLVTSSENIILYATNLDDSTGDSYIIYPIDNLGTQYVAISYPHELYKRSYIGCVAACDDTNIMVTPSINSTLKLDEISYQNQFPIHLKQFENFQIEAMDITGSVVTSDKVIACFTGHRYVNILCGNVNGGSDHMEEQLFPVSTWSYRHFIVSSSRYRADAGDVIRIVSFNSTFVNIVTKTSGVNKCDRIHLSSGLFHEFLVTSGKTAFVTADNPVLVGQFSCSGSISKSIGDSRIILSMADDQFLPEYTFFTPAINLTSQTHTYGLILIADNLVRDYIILDNQDVSDYIIWRPITSVGYSFGEMSIGIGVHKLQSHVTGRYGGYIYGYLDNEEFGTVIGRNLDKDKSKVSTPQKNHLNGYTSAELVMESDNATFTDQEMMSFETNSVISCLSVCLQFINCLHAVVFREAGKVNCMLYGYETVCSEFVQSDRHTVYRNILS